jgi:hypothetical protein
MSRCISVNFDVLLVSKLYIYIPLPNLNSDDVIVSRENSKILFTSFCKSRALQLLYKKVILVVLPLKSIAMKRW